METTYEQIFINEQTDFFNYLVNINAFKSSKTYRDYITRLKYVSHYYKLDKSISEEYVKFILNDLVNTMDERDRYNTKSGIRDIQSALRRFLSYAKSDYQKRINDSIIKKINEIQKDNTIEPTEKEAIIMSRLGQGKFRLNLINYWGGCSITRCRTCSLLLASHIRPWRNSDNFQRLDIFNGLLLTPNLDKLFDKGYISFDNYGKIIQSSFLPTSEFKLLGIDASMKLIHVDDRHLPYLNYHRNNCLI